MNYVRFWMRSVLLLVPLTFILLYFVVHVSLSKVILAIVFEAAFGLLTVIPFVFMLRSVDRNMWSEDEYARRVERRRSQIAEQRRQRDLQYRSPASVDGSPEAETDKRPDSSHEG